MSPRAAELIHLLNLQPHPEGGYYRRIHQSGQQVLRQADNIERRAMTTIYYLLTEDTVSRWHRVLADEAWHHYEGAQLELLTFAADGSKPSVCQLGPLAFGGLPVAVVPCGWWQAARTLGAYSLVGCTVAPGFEFDDFVLFADLPEAARPPTPDIPDFCSYL